jgi:nitrite reductase/ring-hydroxylating ferredoxin subunit
MTSVSDGSFDTGISLGELDPERPRPVETPWGMMALYVVDGRAHCVQAFCPHLEGPLFEGSLSRGVITCPWHGWRFDVRTGERVDFFRARFGEGAKPLARCEVDVGPNGTLVLRRR